jgi:Variant SH3 domain
MEAERLEIDPQMWNAIKLQVTDVWIQIGEVDPSHPSTKRVKAISTCELCRLTQGDSLITISDASSDATHISFKKGDLFSVLEESGDDMRVVNVHGVTGSEKSSQNL